MIQKKKKKHIGCPLHMPASICIGGWVFLINTQLCADPHIQDFVPTESRCIKGQQVYMRAKAQKVVFKRAWLDKETFHTISVASLSTCIYYSVNSGAHELEQRRQSKLTVLSHY